MNSDLRVANDELLRRLGMEPDHSLGDELGEEAEREPEPWEVEVSVRALATCGSGVSMSIARRKLSKCVLWQGGTVVIDSLVLRRAASPPHQLD